jgi:hypothetical protein
MVRVISLPYSKLFGLPRDHLCALDTEISSVAIPILHLNASHRYRISALILCSAGRPEKFQWWRAFIAVEIRPRNDASMLRVVIR